jgi:hypothetical protein
MRLRDTVAHDLNTVFEYVPATFGMDLKPETLRDTLEELARSKVSDYIHQRYRDWAAKDLLTAIELIDEEIKRTKKLKKQEAELLQK